MAQVARRSARNPDGIRAAGALPRQSRRLPLRSGAALPGHYRDRQGAPGSRPARRNQPGDQSLDPSDERLGAIWGGRSVELALATLAAGAGDCEDYAIAKYVALREAGLDNEDLRLLVVRDTNLHRNHAVVAARLDGHWLVLDSRWLMLLEDLQLKQYAPLFEIDDDGVKWLVSRETLRSSSRMAPDATRAASEDAAPSAH